MRFKFLIAIFFVNLSLCFGQVNKAAIDSLTKELSEVVDIASNIKVEIHQLKWSDYMDELKSYGLPSADYLQHTAYFFEYSEDHEQAKWVSHMIAPEVEGLGFARTNNFRIDPLVVTGTTDSTDYFFYERDKNGIDIYETYGYDRGHLAPSADFRWYKETVSESYFYSNISPQDSNLNRKKWSELESMLRGYVIRHQVPLAVVTAPILNDDLAKIPESPNGVSIPDAFIKVAYDFTNKRTIGFYFSNNLHTKPLDTYAISVDEVETLTGYDYFTNIDQSLEANVDITQWFSDYAEGSVLPIKQNQLGRGKFNTKSAATQMNSYKDVIVCGKVVSSRNSGKGNAWIDLDKKYPNSYFSVFIYKNQLTNFDYDPVKYLEGKEVCVEGQIGNWTEKPVMKVQYPSQIRNSKRINK